MKHARPEEPERVLLIRVGARQVAAIPAGEPGRGWGPLLGAALDTVAAHLFTEDGAPVKPARVRVFTMRPGDLKAWDTLQRHGSGGHRLGPVWRAKGLDT